MTRSLRHIALASLLLQTLPHAAGSTTRKPISRPSAHPAWLKPVAKAYRLSAGDLELGSSLRSRRQPSPNRKLQQDVLLCR